MNILYTSVVVLYVLAMLAVGYWCIERTKSVGDFFLGGRTLGPWMSAFAYGTTYFSAVLFIGYAGRLGWGFGIQTLWIALGNTLIGTLFAWQLLARRTRDMTARLNVMTMPEFLCARYGSKPLQVIAALVVFLFLVPYSGSVYMGLSYLFQKALGLEYSTALIFLAALTGVYLVMGGYFAVAVSDFIRGILEFAAVAIMVLLLANMKGGFYETFTRLLDPKVHARAAPAASAARSTPAGRHAIPRLAYAGLAGAHYEFWPMGAATDGAKILFDSQQSRRESGDDHCYNICPVHVLRGLLQRGADSPVLHES